MWKEFETCQMGRFRTPKLDKIKSIYLDQESFEQRLNVYLTSTSIEFSSDKIWIHIGINLDRII